MSTPEEQTAEQKYEMEETMKEYIGYMAMHENHCLPDKDQDKAAACEEKMYRYGWIEELEKPPWTTDEEREQTRKKRM
jgi:hypothetical protein